MLSNKFAAAPKPFVRTTVTSRSRLKEARRSVCVRARSDSQRGSSRSVLEAFFLGRAFADTINDRLGAAVGDLLSDIAKADAERRQSWKEFEAEVQDRASAAFSKSTQGNYTQKRLPDTATLPRTTTGAPVGPIRKDQPLQQNSTASLRLLQESVDDLRAEIAAARSELQQLRAAQSKGKL